MILRNPRLSTVDPNLRMQPAAPYIVLEFLRQLSCEAAYLFQSIREALEEFWNAKRKRPFFPRQTKSLASHLGLVYEALKLDNPEVENKINRVSEEGEQFNQADFHRNSVLRKFRVYLPYYCNSSNV